MSSIAIVIVSHKTYHLLVAGNYTTVPKKLCRKLNEKGVEILFAENHDSLIRYMQDTNTIDAVLLDHDETTAAYITEIKNRAEALKNHPLLILTSKFRTSSMALALQAGFDEFLAKPLGLHQIFTLLKIHTNKNET